MSEAEDDRAETARKLFSGPVSFLKSAPELRFLPDPKLPEIAFAGRSNVGKSSLLNRLTNRSSLARTSNTPGRTQELNIFEVGDPPLLRLVDMPGYGFARAPKEVARRWRFLVNDYLRGRPVLKRTLLLIDSRHGIKDIDLFYFDASDLSWEAEDVIIKAGEKHFAKLPVAEKHEIPVLQFVPSDQIDPILYDKTYYRIQPAYVETREFRCRVLHREVRPLHDANRHLRPTFGDPSLRPLVNLTLHQRRAGLQALDGGA